MSKPGHPIREAMLALAREELRGTQHPSTSRLIAYYRGEIRPPEAAVIAEHLSLCEKCTSIALDVAEFFADDEEEEPTPADLEGSWQELRAATPIALERPSSPIPALSPPKIPRRSLVRSLAFAYGVAAAFAAISIGLVLFHGRSPVPRPQVNAGLYDLTSSGSQRGEGAAHVTPIRLQSSGASALLILNPAVAANSARYGVRIRRPDRGVVWRSEDLELQAPGAFHLSLPAGALPPGLYAVELYGITEGRERVLGIYWIEIEK